MQKRKDSVLHLTLAAMNPKHFAGLDGLRFISITFVVLHHLFHFKTNFGFTATIFRCYC
jgi:peptidoglycan/LPS O-acetylase OafA/YrhL